MAGEGLVNLTTDGSVSLSNEQRKILRGQQQHLRLDTPISSSMYLAHWLWLCSCCWLECITDKQPMATTLVSLLLYKSCPVSLWPDRYCACPPAPALCGSQPDHSRQKRISHFAVLSGVGVLWQIKFVSGARCPAVLQWPTLALWPCEPRPASRPTLGVPPGQVH